MDFEISKNKYWFSQFKDIEDFIKISPCIGEWGTKADNTYVFNPLESKLFAEDLAKFLKEHSITLFNLRDYKFDREDFPPLDKN